MHKKRSEICICGRVSEPLSTILSRGSSSCPNLPTGLISGGSYCSFSLLHYSSYYTYCSKKMLIVLVFLLRYYSSYYANQACNIYKYWSYNMNLRVKHLTIFFANQFNVTKNMLQIFILRNYVLFFLQINSN